MSRPPRRFTLADAMILVAGTAADMAAVRALPPFVRPGPSWRGFMLFRQRMDFVYAPAASLLLLSWAVSLLICRACPPRPSLRRLTCQPGSVACLAAVAAALIPLVARPFGLVAATLLDRPAHLRGSGFRWDHHAWLLYYNGVTVAVAWIILALGRRWRAEPSWIDRAGRLVGFAWIGIALFVLVVQAV